MSNEKITWRFQDSRLWFSSDPTKFLKHVAKGTKDLEMHPDTKIIFSDDVSRFLAARFYDGGDSANSVQVESVPEPTPTPETPETVLVPGMLDSVGDVSDTPDPLPTPTDARTPGSRNSGADL